MTNPRQALEEAFKVVFPEPANYTRACQDPSVSDEYLVQLDRERQHWRDERNRFRRFLDAEAWTDAAMMLVDQRAKSSALRKAWADVSEKLALHIRYMRDDVDYSAEIALALAQACLKARENGDE